MIIRNEKNHKELYFFRKKNTRTPTPECLYKQALPLLSEFRQIKKNHSHSGMYFYFDVGTRIPECLQKWGVPNTD